MDFRILKMIATSGFLTALECTKLVFGLGSVLDYAGSLQRSQDPGLSGALLLWGRQGKREEKDALNANFWTARDFV